MWNAAKSLFFFSCWIFVGGFIYLFNFCLKLFFFFFAALVSRPFWNANIRKEKNRRKRERERPPLMLFQLIDSGPFFGGSVFSSVMLSDLLLLWIFYLLSHSFKYIFLTYWYILMAWLFIIIIIIVHSWPLPKRPNSHITKNFPLEKHGNHYTLICIW